jgi:hypothetical protein
MGEISFVDNNECSNKIDKEKEMQTNLCDSVNNNFNDEEDILPQEISISSLSTPYYLSKQSSKSSLSSTKSGSSFKKFFF